MGYSEANIEIKKSILKGLKTLEKALQSGYLQPSQVDYIINGDPESDVLEGMAWTRNHLRKERGWPTPVEIERKLFRSVISKMDFDDLCTEVAKPFPSHEWNRQELYKMIFDIVGGKQGHLMPAHDTPLHRCYHLPTFHPDKVDVYNYRFYIPTDTDGFPIEGFNKDDMSQEPAAINARKQFGISGQQMQGGEKAIRYTLPEISDNNRFIVETMREKAAAKQKRIEKDSTLTDGGAITDAVLRKWMKDRIQEENNELEERLKKDKKKFKELLKAGEVTQEDYDNFNIREQVQHHKRENEARYLDKGNPHALRQQAHIYRKWKQQQARDKR